MELHRGGVLTSATLMANAVATMEAVELARATPTLGIGCHVVLVDGTPLLPAAEVHSLIDKRTGRFYGTLGKFLSRLFSGRIRSAEIEAEARAQIARLQGLGVHLTHVDTHKHTHMFPAVLKPLLGAAQACEIRVVRNPFEPQWSVTATPGAPWARRVEVNVLRRLEPGFRRIVLEERFATTNGAIGVLATGTLDEATVSSLASALPEGTFELVTHPGYNDAELARAHTRLLTSRETERRDLSVLKQHAGLKLVSFAAVGKPPVKIA